MIIKCSHFFFQDTCQGVTNIVVSLAENHTKLMLDCSLEQDEAKKSNMIKLTHLVLVSTVYDDNVSDDNLLVGWLRYVNDKSSFGCKCRRK